MTLESSKPTPRASSQVASQQPGNSLLPGSLSAGNGRLRRRPVRRADLARSRVRFPAQPGSTPATSLNLPDLRHKQLIFNQLELPGRVHVYRADCPAGARLRVHVLTPHLQTGRAVTPAVAVVAQSLPYHAAGADLPIPLPAGYSAVTLMPPDELLIPAKDWLTGALYYSGPIVDARTLVGGRCYVVVWSPDNAMGRYMLQVGYAPQSRGRAMLQAPWVWWRVRGWYGKSRRTAVWLPAALLLLGAMLFALLRLILGLSGRANRATGPGAGTNG